MNIVTNEEKKSIVMRNCIKVDDVPIKYQEITINSEDPNTTNFSSFFASDEAKTIYKTNRTAIREAEAAFEDKAYLVQESLATIGEVK
ncbi:hypothetical protein [Massilimicrobiota sp. An134]|uniref:hypothetical protein n=1 Tax=Massilimicrobiota sp. An134 TaxID=1965557 RepID=UPI000B3B00D6|nr:hypothetical protein [Massilimicrobiota sp. An134]OUQ31123.1 hypothetical protein B5E79_00400 [Massilimicrobiota sp. An134]